MINKRYNDFSRFFKDKFGFRVQKLSIDAGFTCPNRDGSRGVGGCTYCNNDSFSPDYCRDKNTITEQIEIGKSFFKHKYQGQKYLAYFQSYSNTYDDLAVLKEKYEEALSCDDIIGVVIATRPDAIDAEKLDYIEFLAKKYYVCIEYGVESLDNNVLESINRGHTAEESVEAIKMSVGRGIFIGAHLICGLPNETKTSIVESAIKLSNLSIDMIKLHQLQIIRGTKMAKQYSENPDMFSLYSLDEYLDMVVGIIENISPGVYLERFVNQSPDKYLLAPKWGIKNFEFVDKLDKILNEKDTFQGKYWHNPLIT